MPGPVFLEGERVELRTIEEEDLSFLQETINDPSVRQFIGSRNPVNGHQEREWYEERGSDEEHVRLLICRDGEPMGTVGLHPRDEIGVTDEIGIFLAPDYWGEGFGTEASRILTDYAFRERRTHRVMARVFEGNEASRHVWEKLDFRHEGTFVESEYIDGEYVDTNYFAVTKTEWFEE